MCYWQCHEAITAHNCCSTAACLSEVIFKDLAVPSSNCKANVIGSWFVLVVAMFTDTGIRRQVM